jgi:serine/threonine-protein kinase
MFCPKCEGWFGGHFRFCPYDGRRLEQRQPEREEPTPPSLVGSELETRYRIRKLIGEGAMARVFLAQDLRSGEPVALKLLNSRMVGNREQRVRFAREWNLIRELEHRNILTVFGAGELRDGTPYMVMERLFGESLGDAIQREGKFPLPLAIPTLQQAAAALYSVHERGIVHRDVKPDNLFLVGQPGQLRSVKVLDFGLSRIWKSTLTSAGTVIGTPQFMAPEQVVADHTDQRTDVYALGMVMYRALTGTLPFEGKEQLELLACQLLIPAPRPREVAADIDPRCELVICTATAKRPEHRYPSMQIFQQDLARLESPTARLWAHEVPEEGYDLTSPNAAAMEDTFREILASRGITAPQAG